MKVSLGAPNDLEVLHLEAIDEETAHRVERETGSGASLQLEFEQP